MQPGDERDTPQAVTPSSAMSKPVDLVGRSVRRGEATRRSGRKASRRLPVRAVPDLDTPRMLQRVRARSGESPYGVMGAHHKALLGEVPDAPWRRCAGWSPQRPTVARVAARASGSIADVVSKSHPTNQALIRVTGERPGSTRHRSARSPWRSTSRSSRSAGVALDKRGHRQRTQGPATMCASIACTDRPLTRRQRPA